ncbi:MAG: biopolymer transporter ExbD [Myxococcota bacterium]
MPVHVPGKVLLHHIPLKFVRDKVAGGGKKSVDQSLPLVPFIDFLITLVVFLIMSFSASGELVAQKASITMPSASNTETLEIAPIVAIDDRVVTLDGTQVADTSTLAQDARMERIEPFIQALEAKSRNWSLLHPNETFPAAIIVQADIGVDFRVVKKVMFSAAQAGYANVSFAVNKTGDS